MNVRFRWAVVVLAAGMGSVLWTVLTGEDPPAVALFIGAAAAPIAVLLLVWGRTGERFPASALIGGALVGPAVALAGHALVFAFAAAFLRGFLQSGRALLEALRIDPRIREILSSPWLLLLLVDVSMVAPLTEETGKALGARLARPASRRDAFLAGVAAGAGFAVVENALYALAAALFGGPWAAVVVARAMGAAVHPLACGLVMTGWWDARHGSGGAVGRGFFAGVGVHAVWNASMVALLVAETAVHERGGPGLMGATSLVFTGALGVVAVAVLWRLIGSVIEGRTPVSELRALDARTVAGWILLTACLLVPVAILILAFPGFYLG